MKSFVKEHIMFFQQELPQNVTLVAVSKFHPIETLKDAYAAGQRIFGESRVQELSVKHGQMPDDVKWHFIGHLQSNKVRQLVPYVSLIHSVDTLRILQAINEEASKINKIVDVLIQLHVAKEESKFGFDINDCFEMFNNGTIAKLSNIRICGVMGMATNVDDDNVIHSEFKEIKDIFNQLKSNFFAQDDYFDTVSMGMSDDYRIAIEEGSTMVRIGSTIFGAREY